MLDNSVLGLLTGALGGVPGEGSARQTPRHSMYPTDQKATSHPQWSHVYSQGPSVGSPSYKRGRNRDGYSNSGYGYKRSPRRLQLHALTVTQVGTGSPASRPSPPLFTFLGEDDEFCGLECLSIQCPGDSGRGIRGHLALE